MQRQILGFKLKIRIAKQPATDSYLYLSPKWVILLPGILRLRLSMRSVSSYIPHISASAGIKGVPHHCSVSTSNYSGCWD